MLLTDSETEINFWKLRAVDFLIETGIFVKNSEVASYRDETLNRLGILANSDSIHLLSKTDQVSEMVIYSTDHQAIGTFTDTSFLLKSDSSDSLIYHEQVQVPGRSHFLKKYSSAIYLPIDESFYTGAVILAWTNTFTPPPAYSIFLNVALTRIKGIMRLTSTKFAAEDLSIKFDAVFHTVSQGLIFMDDSGKEALVSEQAKRILGVTQEGEKFPPVLIAEAMKKLREKADNKEEINNTALALFKEPEKKQEGWLWKFTDKVFSVSSSPTISDRIKGRLWVFEDISDLYFANHNLKYANKDIQVKNERLEALNLEKNDLIGIVSHDLRSPFAQIKMLSTLLKMDAHPLSDEQQSTLALMEQVADKGMRLIKDLLDISAIEQQQINKKIEKLNITDIIHSAMEGFKSIADKKNITIDLIQLTDQTTIMADHDYISRILDNLVSNAIKFSHPNKKITLTLSKKEDDALLLAVKDEGQGISEEEMKKLFGKFSRLSARPTAKESSTGLGLFIVKSLVEEMNGRIWCESIARNGATFFVELPIVIA